MDFVFCSLLIRCKDTQVPRTAQEGFCFPCVWKNSRLSVSATAQSNNCTAKGDSSVGEGAVHPTWAVVVFPMMVMMVLFFYSLSGKICDASCNLKMF